MYWQQFAKIFASSRPRVFALYHEADGFVNLHPEFFHLEMCGARRNLLAASESERINQMEKGSCVNSQKQTASGINLHNC